MSTKYTLDHCNGHSTKYIFQWWTFQIFVLSSCWCSIQQIWSWSRLWLPKSHVDLWKLYGSDSSLSMYHPSKMVSSDSSLTTISQGPKWESLSSLWISSSSLLSTTAARTSNVLLGWTSSLFQNILSWSAIAEVKCVFTSCLPI